jgi:hypothetical protein
MRFYPISKINIYNLKSKLKKIHFKQNTCKIMLTDNGFYKNIKGDLFLYKFNFKEKTKIIENYIGDKSFILTHDTWLKIDKRYKLPIVNKIIELKTLTYTMRKDAPVKFVCEYIDSEIRDFYFVIPEDFEMDILVKEDICSFLTNLD